MKRIIFLLALSVLPFLAGAQDFIDDLFNRYSGKDNFTSIVISKDLLDFAFNLDKDKDLDKLKGKISDLKILISEHKNGSLVGFTNEIRDNLNKDSYLSLIEILDGKTKVSFYAQKDNDKIVHLLLLATEEDQDVLLSLKGQFTMKDLAELGNNSNNHGSFHHLSYLKNLDEQ
jgi:hypothetical protein